MDDRNLLSVVLPTQFIFATSAIYSRVEPLRRLEFTPLAKMTNCNPNHRGEERNIIFWWKRLLDVQTKPINPKPIHYENYGKPVENLSAGCCGFKILQSRLPLTPYFSLIRMPLALKKTDLTRLKKHGYRLIDTGSFATFWLNGDPIRGGQ